MKTDLDRLHYVVEHKQHFELIGAPRGIGRTFASCHNLAGLLETCESGSLIVWLLPYMHWFDHIKPMVIQVLKEHQLVFAFSQRHKLICNRKIVRFIVDREENIRGLSDCYFVDTFGETREHVELGHPRAVMPTRQQHQLSSKQWKKEYRGEFRFEL